jgi:murein L,D-transpeptidase YafK
MTRAMVVGAVLIAGCARPTARPTPAAPLSLREQAARLGLKYPFQRVFLRALKQERTLELWASNGGGPMALVRRYPIAAASGGPGPKRREGDFQVPEGVYRIDRFNPHSRFHLSLGLDYPNASDRVRSGTRPGKDIFIHGNRVSIGCMAMTDPVIEEIYGACRSARNARSIPVHVFPCRMDGPLMRDLVARYPQNSRFWSELRPIYDAFEVSHQVPKVRIGRGGEYSVIGDTVAALGIASPRT